MRAISIFSFEEGTSTFGWRALSALRTRVSMSAMGSLTIRSLYRLLPAGFDDARDFARERQVPETDPAQFELAEEPARPAATRAAVALPASQLRRLRLLLVRQHQVFCYFGRGCHLCLSRFLYCRNGIPSCFSSATPSASVFAVVVMQMFMPLIFSTLL